MEVAQKIMMIVAAISGIALVLSVMLQTNRAESFSAAMGGADSRQFRKGSREEMLGRLTKFSAIIWIGACLVNAVLWYRLHETVR